MLHLTIILKCIVLCALICDMCCYLNVDWQEVKCANYNIEGLYSSSCNIHTVTNNKEILPKLRYSKYRGPRILNNVFMGQAQLDLAVIYPDS